MNCNCMEAMTKMSNGDFESGFKELSQEFKTNGEDKNVIKVLDEALLSPNIETMTEFFQKNVEFLNNYPYIFTRNFVEPNYNRFMILPINQDVFYCYDSNKHTFFKIETNSERETRYFFENLDKPLFVENEFNEYNLKFIEDNVRDSCDFAGDNHIYLWYENTEMFSLLLYYVDLVQLFSRKKFVVLIGDEREKYPLDFNTKFGINYSEMKPQKLRIEEMKRICYWVTRYHSGTIFSLDVLNQNKHIISPYWEFVFFRKVCALLPELSSDLNFDVSISIEQCVYAIDSVKHHDNYIKDDRSQIKNELKKDLFEIGDSSAKITPKELLLRIMLLSYYKKNPDNNPRITPIIIFDPHIQGAGEVARKWYLFMLKFPYITSLSVIREQMMTVQQVNKDLRQQFGERFGFNLMGGYEVEINVPDEVKGIYNIFRFEDLKMYPEEMSIALSEYLDVPYDAQMIKDNEIDKEITKPDDTITLSIDKVKPKSTFDKLVLNKQIDESIFPLFDQARLQIYYSPINSRYGYPAFDFESCPMTDNEVIFLFKYPFKIEKEYSLLGVSDQEMREFLFNQMSSIWLAARKGQIFFPPLIRPKFDKKKEDEK